MSTRKKLPPKKKRRIDSDSEDNYVDDGDAEDSSIVAAKTANMHPNPHSLSRHTLSPTTITRLRASLLKWYDPEHAKRGMPWRRAFHEPLSKDKEERSQSAYQVWISEIMCQQTQVATVIPYYNRWMEKFPTIQALASSDIATVHTLWKGLGYYSRATRLLAGAQKVVNDFDGRLPEDPKELEKEVPGVGRYSSSAIASIAYGARVGVLDGNTTRLLSRLLGLHASTKSKTTLDILWKAADAFVEDEICTFPGDVNQALIELGSTVCRVKDPSCVSCPMRDGCAAYLESEQSTAASVKDIEDICDVCISHVHPASYGVTRYPMKVEKKKAREETDLVLALEYENDDQTWVVMEKRPDEGLLGGLWNFPNISAISPDSTEEDLEALIPEMVNRLFVKGLPSKALDLDAAKSRSKAAQKQKAGGLSSFFKPKTAEVPAQHDTDAQDLHAKRLLHASPVLHLFSHIRKTYRPVHLVLRGGSFSDLPALSSISTTESEKPKKKKRKKATDDEDDEGESNELGELKWVKREDVESTIVGTCITKIWQSVSEPSASASSKKGTKKTGTRKKQSS